LDIAAMNRQLCDEFLARLVGQTGDVAARHSTYGGLKQRQYLLLGCLYEPAAEPTNNRAERALRPADSMSRQRLPGRPDLLLLAPVFA
jgi:hypothetical protein